MVFYKWLATAETKIFHTGSKVYAGIDAPKSEEPLSSISGEHWLSPGK